MTRKFMDYARSLGGRLFLGSAALCLGLAVAQPIRNAVRNWGSEDFVGNIIEYVSSKFHERRDGTFYLHCDFPGKRVDISIKIENGRPLRYLNIENSDFVSQNGTSTLYNKRPGFEDVNGNGRLENGDNVTWVYYQENGYDKVLEEADKAYRDQLKDLNTRVQELKHLDKLTEAIQEDVIETGKPEFVSDVSVFPKVPLLSFFTKRSGNNFHKTYTLGDGSRASFFVSLYDNIPKLLIDDSQNTSILPRYQDMEIMERVVKEAGLKID